MRHKSGLLCSPKGSDDGEINKHHFWTDVHHKSPSDLLVSAGMSCCMCINNHDKYKNTETFSERFLLRFSVNVFIFRINKTGLLGLMVPKFAVICEQKELQYIFHLSARLIVLIDLIVGALSFYSTTFTQCVALNVTLLFFR